MFNEVECKPGNSHPILRMFLESLSERTRFILFTEKTPIKEAKISANPIAKYICLMPFSTSHFIIEKTLIFNWQ